MNGADRATDEERRTDQPLGAITRRMTRGVRAAIENLSVGVGFFIVRTSPAEGEATFTASLPRT